MKSTYMHAFMLLACGFTFALMGHTIMGLQALGVVSLLLTYFVTLLPVIFRREPAKIRILQMIECHA